MKIFKAMGSLLAIILLILGIGTRLLVFILKGIAAMLQIAL